MPTIKKPKILIADDSIIARRMIAGHLDRVNADIHEAVDGSDALEKIRAIAPDLLILDLLMPGIDGFEVLTRLSTAKIKLPVIVLTADIQQEVKDECMALGAIGFLNKPIRGNDFIDLVNQTIGVL